LIFCHWPRFFRVHIAVQSVAKQLHCPKWGNSKINYTCSRKNRDHMIIIGKIIWTNYIVYFFTLIFFRIFFFPILPETTLSDSRRQTINEKMAVVYALSTGSTQTFYSSEFDAC
jgi:hypothetical protein